MGAPLRILITAGPTHERIDDVRYVANRSSGRMGIALAEAARRAGYDVTLLLGPVPIEPGCESGCSDQPPSRIFRFESTADLQRLLAEHFPRCDVLIMAAAVADYRPAAGVPGKIARQQGGRLTLELESTPDLVAECAARKRPDQRIIAFALEQAPRLHQRALEKMRAKGADAIVANPLATMGSDRVSAVLYTADGRSLTPDSPRMGKPEFAAWLLQRIRAVCSL